MEDDNMGNQIFQNARATQQVTATAFASKYKSKLEVYNFLAVDCKCYLPEYKQVTIYFLKDIVRGYKKCKSHLINL